jgi:adenylate cyclase
MTQETSLSSATAELTKAVSLDPQYAAAWAALSRTYSLSPVFGVSPSSEALPKARDAAMRAIALDDRSPVAHCTLAFVKAHYDFYWSGAEREFQRAIALNPSDPTSHLFYSNSFLSPQGRHDEAIAEMKIAIALDPLSFPIQSFLGRTLLWAGRTVEALAQFAKANQLSPNSALGHMRLAHAYSYLARYEDAIAEEERARILAGESPEATIAKGHQLRDAFRQRGGRGYWEQQLQFAKLHENPPESYVGSYGLAILYTQLADREKAMTALSQAFKEHDLRLSEIGLEPLFNPLRTDPSFIDYENRVGLPVSKTR